MLEGTNATSVGTTAARMVALEGSAWASNASALEDDDAAETW
jgi:hypothetical protein